MIHYSHTRNRDELNKPSQYGGITIAATFEPNLITFGFALCSPKEKFCKADGREIATDRLERNPITLSIEEYREQSAKQIMGQSELIDASIIRLYECITFDDIRKESLFMHMINKFDKVLPNLSDIERLIPAKRLNKNKPKVQYTYDEIKLHGLK